MPLEDAIHISDLVPDWPQGPSDPVSIGDDNLRMLKKVLQNDLPNINGPITGTPTQINNITLNTPWIDNSATAGAISNFNLTDPSKTDGSLATIGVATPQANQMTENPALVVNWQLMMQLVWPVGGEFRNYTDQRNPVEILGFGTWEAVTGLIAGVGSATDSQGYTQNYYAGYQPGWWRVQNGHIVAKTLQLAMNPVDPHFHNMDRYPVMEDRKNAEGSGSYAAPASYTTQATESAGGHTPSGSVTIGGGSSTDSAAFYNPYYGCYIWKRTA